MQLNIGPLQTLEQTDSQRHTAGAADADDKSSPVDILCGHCD